MCDECIAACICSVFGWLGLGLARLAKGARSERAKTRIYALLNISSIGLVVLSELYLDPRMINVKRAIRTIRNKRDSVIGLKPGKVNSDA
ncbi:MAG: hypothetical protein WBD13_01165 [Burkholderiaceae bacterium]